ncbi:MAG: hypothetical protein V3U49_02055 [Nitrososphaerales archaeon]
MSPRSSKWIYIVASVGILAAAGFVIITFFSQDTSGPTEVPESWEGILNQANEEGQIRIFLDVDLGVRGFLETTIIPEFQEKHDISVEIETGHWSGLTQRLITERLGGRSVGLLDLALVGDEAMGRSLDASLLFAETGSKLDKASQIEEIFRRGVSGITNDGSSVTIWIDQYVLVGNAEFLDDLLLDLGEMIELISGEDEGRIDPDQLFVPNPLETDTGAAALMLVVIDRGGKDLYSFRPHDSTLEAEWPAALGFEVEDEPELEEFPMPEEEPPQNALEAVIEGELSFAYLRYDEILSYVADGGIFPPEIRVYLPVEGSIISGGHAGIPFNAPNKSAALIFLDFLLSEEVQIEFALELGKYPSIATITDDSLPERITASSIWIPRVEARGEWIPWPHFQYRVDLLDLWRNLTGE